jgi:hypothetical protein
VPSSNSSSLPVVALKIPLALGYNKNYSASNAHLQTFPLCSCRVL